MFFIINSNIFAIGDRFRRKAIESFGLNNNFDINYNVVLILNVSLVVYLFV